MDQTEKYQGTVAKIMDRGFGFIRRDGLPDLFFHANDCVSDFGNELIGQRVEYNLRPGRDERPKAVYVRVVP